MNTDRGVDWRGEWKLVSVTKIENKKIDTILWRLCDAHVTLALVKGRCFWGVRFKSSSDVTLLRTFCKIINLQARVARKITLSTG